MNVSEICKMLYEVDSNVGLNFKPV